MIQKYSDYQIKRLSLGLITSFMVCGLVGANFGFAQTTSTDTSTQTQTNTTTDTQTATATNTGTGTGTDTSVTTTAFAIQSTAEAIRNFISTSVRSGYLSGIRNQIQASSTLVGLIPQHSTATSFRVESYNTAATPAEARTELSASFTSELAPQACAYFIFMSDSSADFTITAGRSFGPNRPEIRSVEGSETPTKTVLICNRFKSAGIPADAPIGQMDLRITNEDKLGVARINFDYSQIDTLSSAVSRLRAFFSTIKNQRLRGLDILPGTLAGMNIDQQAFCKISIPRADSATNLNTNITTRTGLNACGNPDLVTQIVSPIEAQTCALFTIQTQNGEYSNVTLNIIATNGEANNSAETLTLNPLHDSNTHTKVYCNLSSAAQTISFNGRGMNGSTDSIDAAINRVNFAPIRGLNIPYDLSSAISAHVERLARADGSGLKQADAATRAQIIEAASRPYPVCLASALPRPSVLTVLRRTMDSSHSIDSNHACGPEGVSQFMRPLGAGQCAFIATTSFLGESSSAQTGMGDLDIASTDLVVRDNRGRTTLSATNIASDAATDNFPSVLVCNPYSVETNIVVNISNLGHAAPTNQAYTNANGTLVVSRIDFAATPAQMNFFGSRSDLNAPEARRVLIQKLSTVETLRPAFRQSFGQQIVSADRSSLPVCQITYRNRSQFTDGRDQNFILTATARTDSAHGCSASQARAIFAPIAPGQCALYAAEGLVSGYNSSLFTLYKSAVSIPAQRGLSAVTIGIAAPNFSSPFADTISYASTVNGPITPTHREVLICNPYTRPMTTKVFAMQGNPRLNNNPQAQRGVITRINFTGTPQQLSDFSNQFLRFQEQVTGRNAAPLPASQPSSGSPNSVPSTSSSNTSTGTNPRPSRPATSRPAPRPTTRPTTQPTVRPNTAAAAPARPSNPPTRPNTGEQGDM